MKLAFALLASGFLTVSACKTSNHLESETVSANGKRNLVPKECKNEQSWKDIGCEKDPVTKQLRSRQVVVLRLLKIDESLKEDLASRKPSIELCAGWVRYWDGTWKEGVGFWLNGLWPGVNQLGGCFPGVDYKLLSDGQEHSGLNSQGDLIQFDNKGANVVSVPPAAFFSINKDQLVYELCTGHSKFNCILFKNPSGALEVRPY